jgi:eukaryotic-like serine/threonine-protein kinase
MPLLAGSVLKDDIVLERQLGTGAMGVVWVARHRALDTKLAVKVLSQSAARDAEARARFAQEARIVARIDSPHVVRIHDYGVTEDGAPFFVMELLRGRDLRAELAEKGTLDLAATGTIVRQACAALGRAHDLDIVHRDIKPANVFLVDSAEGVFVKVLDFGIAKLARGEALDLTATTALLGTPYYMSPEQFVDPRTIDHRADLWSLAVVAYACLVGSLPFAGETVGALSIAVHRNEFRGPCAVRPELPSALDAWFRRALDPDPSRRFRDAATFTETFSAALRNEPLDDEVSRGPRSARAVDSRVALLRKSRWDEEGGVASSVNFAQRYRPRTVAAVAVGVALAAAVPVIYAARSRDPEPLPARVVSPQSSSADVPREPAAREEGAAPIDVRIAIRPAGASVSVDGAPRDVKGGFLELRGRPGARFSVVAAFDGETVERTVSITDAGRATVDSIEVEPRRRAVDRPVRPAQIMRARTEAPAPSTSVEARPPTRDAWDE